MCGVYGSRIGRKAGTQEEVASELLGTRAMELRLGSFNFGITQEHFEGRQWAERGATKFQELVNIDFLKDYDLDVLCGCEVGGHMGDRRGQW